MCCLFYFAPLFFFTVCKAAWVLWENLFSSTVLISFLADGETTKSQLKNCFLLPVTISLLSLTLALTCPLHAPADVGKCRSLAPASSWCWGAGCGADAGWPARSSPAPARSPAQLSPGKGPAAGWSTAAGCSVGSSPGLSPEKQEVQKLLG